MILCPRRLAVVLLLVTTIPQAAAQDDGANDGDARRTRIALGPQVSPAYPGARRELLQPFFDFDRAKPGETFAFEASDESIGTTLIRTHGFEFGPALDFEGARKARDAPGLPATGFTIEGGAFAQYSFRAPVRVRLQLLHGIGGHDGFVGEASADYVARHADKWLFAIGPRLSFSDARFQRAYFGVPAAAAASGLPPFAPSGGVHSIGANAGWLRQLTRHWGLYAFGRYDRLVGDAARSPYIRRDGARDQWTGAIALTYTFFSHRR